MTARPGTSRVGMASVAFAVAVLTAACGGDADGDGRAAAAEQGAAPSTAAAATAPPPAPGSSAHGLPDPTLPDPTLPDPTLPRSTTAPDAPATRVRIPSLGIDLPVMSGDATLPDNPPGYPLCDVAQYLTAYVDPGEPGATYLYAHAREGMFLPLLEASRRDDGQELLGREVLVHAADGAVHRYVVATVIPHATDRRVADTVRPGDHRLVLQTSEGPRGTVPKLQVAARYAGSRPAGPGASEVDPSPRVCA